jgi:hypothetical protein
MNVVISTGQKLIPVGMIYMRMHNIFFANEEFILSILVALGHYTLLKMLDVFRLSAIVEQSGATTYNNLVVVPLATRPPAPHQTRRQSPTGVISLCLVRKTVLVPKKQHIITERILKCCIKVVILCSF